MSELQAEADKLIGELKRLPWWVYPIGGGVALGGVYYWRKHNSSGATGVPASSASSAGAQPEYQPPDGLSMSDLAGLPFDYYDWSPAVTPGGQPLPGSTGTTPASSGTPGSTTGDPAPPAAYPGGVPGGPPAQPIPNPTAPAPAPQPPLRPAPSPAPAPQPPHMDTQVVGHWPAWDSTLSGIASHYGMSWQQLYNFGNDRQVIDSTAHAHGHYGDEYNWLFPGEVLQVP